MLSNGWFCLGRWYKISSTVWEQLGNSLMLLVCALFVCSNATITDVVWPSIISFSGSPFWYNLEVPVALNVYRPLATLVAYINKYTWQSWMTKCVHQNKINILWRVSLSIVHSPISMRIYDCMRWMKATDFAVKMHLLTSTCSFTTRIQSYTNKDAYIPKWQLRFLQIFCFLC